MDQIDQVIGPKAQLASLSLYTHAMARSGYRLNLLFQSIAFVHAESVSRFASDPDAYMDDFGLSERERALVKARDLQATIAAGANPFILFRAFAAMGWTPKDLVAGAPASAASRLAASLERGGYVDGEA